MLNYVISILSTKPGLKKANITETKAYAVAQTSGTMDMEEFASHIAEHGSKYKRGDIYAILAEAVDCMREQLLEGKSNIVICSRAGKIVSTEIRYALVLDRMYKGKLQPGDLDPFTAEQVDEMKRFCEKKRADLVSLYEKVDLLGL